ncbi:hypothetical protein Z945_763 [Sulfitobacter noctilucae]|nr:hypothetical protein Z945_763 [Sulfitobacter noctilucae]
MYCLIYEPFEFSINGYSVSYALIYGAKDAVSNQTSVNRRGNADVRLNCNALHDMA